MTAVPAGRPLIVVATRSAHKLRELRELLHADPAELVDLDAAGVPPGEIGRAHV